MGVTADPVEMSSESSDVVGAATDGRVATRGELRPPTRRRSKRKSIVATDRKPAHPDPRRFQDDYRSRLDVRADLTKVGEDEAGLARGTTVGFATQQDDRWQQRRRRGKEFTEVGVC